MICKYYKSSDLTSVNIGSSVTSIGSSAFSGCGSLIYVYSNNPTPPKMVLSTFDEQTYKNATLFVPKGCKSIYWLHPDWENFARIEEIRIITVEDITNLIDNYLEEGSNIKLDEITSLIDLFLTQQAESKLRGFE